LLLQNDLLADGTIKRNIPFSSRLSSNKSLVQNGQSIVQSKNSLVTSPSQVSTIFHAKSPSTSAVMQDYYILQYQKNLVVQHPLPDD
jgi:hypothetical protein